MKNQALEREETPHTEMQTLKKALFGNESRYEKTPINEVIPSGHLDQEELELMHLYHDLYSELRFLNNKFDLPETGLKNKLLEKIAVMAHFSKAEEGFASEMLITRKSQQFQAMKQKEEVDTGPSIREELLDSISERGDNTGSELTTPDASW
ncbi:MAG: hypothetical protein ABEJ93_04595 [Candidatus Nanohalobium sp.]